LIVPNIRLLNAKRGNTKTNERGKEAGGKGPPFFRVPRSDFRVKLCFRLGLPQTGDAVAVFPLAAFLEQFRALKTLEHIPFAAQCGSRA
jgi:hypothetical protein